MIKRDELKDAKDGEPIGIRFGPELMGWIDNQIKKDRFSSRSGAIRYCVRYTMNKKRENVGMGD